MGLKIKNLVKSFDKKQIFSDFSFDFDDAGVYVILGESGVGITTLLRMICGLDSDFSGEIQGGDIQNSATEFVGGCLCPLYLLTYPKESPYIWDRHHPMLKM